METYLLDQNLGKRGFFKTRRERWAAIFLLCGLGVLLADFFGGIDPVPYMQFLLAIGSLFILGANVESWTKAYGVKSIRQTELREETKRSISITRDESIPNPEIISEAKSRYINDPSYAPQSWIDKNGTSETFR